MSVYSEVLTTKTCSQCNNIQAVTNFQRKKQSKDGLSFYCKACLKINKSKSYQRNKESTKRRTRRWAIANKDKVEIYKKKYQNGNGKSNYARYNRYKSAAGRRGIGFLLSREEAYLFFDSRCNYCGDTALGIDRVDSNKEYTIDNCVPCCGTCNKMKSIHSKEQFLKHCNKIINYSYGCIYQ